MEPPTTTTAGPDAEPSLLRRILFWSAWVIWAPITAAAFAVIVIFLIHAGLGGPTFLLGAAGVGVWGIVMLWWGSRGNLRQPWRRRLVTGWMLALTLGLLAVAEHLWLEPTFTTDSGEPLREWTAEKSSGTFLREAERIEVLSLASDGVPMPEVGASQGDFYGYQIYGATAVSDPALIENVWSDVTKRIADDNSSSVMCFNPRHGIRAFKGDEQRDFVICFECESIRIHNPKSSQPRLYVPLTSASAPLAMDELLDAASIPRERSRR